MIDYADHMYPVDKCTIYTRPELLPDIERSPHVRRIRRSPEQAHDAARSALQALSRSQALQQRTPSPHNYMTQLLRDTQFGHPYQQLRRLWEPRAWAQYSEQPQELRVVLHGQYDNLVLTHAAELAARFQARITIITIGATAQPASLQYVHELRALCAHDITEQHYDSPEAFTTQHASLQRSMLIIHRGTSPQVRELVEHCLHSGSPLWVLGNTPVQWPAQRILIPVDGTPFAYTAVAQGMILAEALHAQLDIMHVQQGDSTQQHNFREALHQLQWDQIEHSTYERQGPVAASIRSFAQTQQADLIILGTHGGYAAQITPQLLELPPADVLIVQPLR